MYSVLTISATKARKVIGFIFSVINIQFVQLTFSITPQYGGPFKGTPLLKSNKHQRKENNALYFMRRVQQSQRRYAHSFYMFCV